LNSIVKDVSPETLYTASYEHFRAYELYCAQAPNGERHLTSELAWGISGVISPYMNSVVKTQLNPETDVDEIIDSVISHARQRSVPMGWFLLPGTKPSNLNIKLEAHGFKYDEDTPGMSVDLELLSDQPLIHDNLKIVEVLDLPTLEQWINVWGDSYNASDIKRKSRFNFRVSQGLDSNSPYRSYLAYLKDQPVATSELFLGAGVSAVVWVGTIPSARRQGIGAAITLAPLLEARRLGYRIGSVTASPIGLPVYQRLGFKEYCRIPVYYWSPTE